MTHVPGEERAGSQHTTHEFELVEQALERMVTEGAFTVPEIMVKVDAAVAEALQEVLSMAQADKAEIVRLQDEIEERDQSFDKQWGRLVDKKAAEAVKERDVEIESLRRNVAALKSDEALTVAALRQAQEGCAHLRASLAHSVAEARREQTERCAQIAERHVAVGSLLKNQVGTHIAAAIRSAPVKEQ